jgi:hypothetical protein
MVTVLLYPEPWYCLQLDPQYEYTWISKARLFVSVKDDIVLDSRGKGRLTIQKRKDSHKHYVTFTTEDVSTTCVLMLSSGLQAGCNGLQNVDVLPVNWGTI